MNETSNALIYWTIVSGIVVLCVFGIYRSAKSYQRKNRYQVWLVSILLGGIVLAILFMNEFLPGSKTYYDYRYSKGITGRSMSVTNVYTYESYVDPFLGDGYSMYIYQFDQESAKYFRNPNKTFFAKYPYSSKGKSSWVTKNWTKCPLDSTEAKFKEFALGENYKYGTSPLTELDRVQMVVGDLLEDEGNYYAYSANLISEEGSVWNISFYVISPKEGWLIALYNDM